jgi:hypothetical protein
MQMRSLLTGLLAAQVVLAGSLFMYNQSQRSNEPAVPLLGFAAADVDKIVVRDSANSATLLRQGDDWKLEEFGGLPANDSRITTLLDNLAALKTQWPVVNSAAGRERFEVSEDKFQRHLALYQGDQLLGEYYFGTSPGFRQTHARRADDDEVYALAFNNVDLPVDDNDWLQKDLLAIGEVTAIKGVDFELMQQDGAWQLQPPPAATETALDADKAKAMASALQNLRVQRVADSPPAGDTVTLTATSAEGSRDYLFTKTGAQYFVKRGDLEQVFTISAADYDKLGAITRASLLQALPETTEESASAAADAADTGSVSLPTPPAVTDDATH